MAGFTAHLPCSTDSHFFSPIFSINFSKSCFERGHASSSQLMGPPQTAEQFWPLPPLVQKTESKVEGRVVVVLVVALVLVVLVVVVVVVVVGVAVVCGTPPSHFSPRLVLWQHNASPKWSCPLHATPHFRKHSACLNCPPLCLLELPHQHVFCTHC